MLSIPHNRTPVLVVDDDVGLLTSIKAILLSSGMPEPALVSDSRKVIEIVRENGFHLVLIDLLMPHLNGMDLLQQLKREFPAIECVIITAVDDVSRAVEAMRLPNQALKEGAAHHSYQ